MSFQRKNKVVLYKVLRVDDASCSSRADVGVAIFCGVFTKQVIVIRVLIYTKSGKLLSDPSFANRRKRESFSNFNKWC